MRRIYHMVNGSQYHLVLYLRVKQTSLMSDEAKVVVETRRRRLREWIDAHYGGLQAAFKDDVGINQGELSGLLSSKSFGEKRARRLEQQARMPSFYLDREQARQGAKDGDVAELKRQVESLMVVIASLIGVTARHRPLEGEEIAQMIRGNQSLSLSDHDLVADILGMIDGSGSRSTRPAAPARKRSAS